MTTPRTSKTLAKPSDRQHERVVGGGIQRRPLATRTPEAIMQMPGSVALAGVGELLLGIDADLTLPPCFDGAR